MRGPAYNAPTVPEAPLFTLAHLSDPHLGPLPKASPGELASKRVLGWLNWHRSRGRRHGADALNALVADLAAEKVDHIAVTGDLINISLAAEFAPAAAWLASLGAPTDVSVGPGNHDVYVARTTGLLQTHWGAYMAGDDGTPGFPFLRRRGEVALIGVSTALPTAPFLATGRLGTAQRDALETLLDETGRAGLCRVVLIHHPLTGDFDFQHRLSDARAVRATLARVGAELVLHGHIHVPSLVRIAGPRGEIPVVGVPSASAAATTAHPAGWNKFTNARGTPWRIVLERRALARDGHAVESRPPRVLAG